MKEGFLPVKEVQHSLKVHQMYDYFLIETRHLKYRCGRILIRTAR